MFRPLVYIQLFVCFSILTALAFSQQPARNPAQEAPIIDELQKTAPKTVDTFKLATQKLDSGDFDGAVLLYNDVLKQAPNSEPAMRRLGYALIGTGKRKEGLAQIQKALDQNRSADNMLGMAYALMSPGKDGYQPSEFDIQNAFVLTRDATKLKNGTDPDALAQLADLALTKNDIQTFNSSVNQLLAYFPNLVQTHLRY